MLVLCALALNSCVTSSLWADHDDEPAYGDRPTYGDRQEQCVLDDFLAKLALTPFTLLIDVLTAPIQACFSDDDDEDESGDESPPWVPGRYD